MMEIVGITLKDGGRVYYFDPNGYKLKKNVTVIVETEQGQQFGKVTRENTKINPKDLTKELKKVIRISNKDDYKKNIKNIKDAKEALIKCQKLVEQKNLKMKIIDASYTFDRDKLIFRFLADNRIDFRELAKDLASIYKVRIELRQIGVRDKAKEVGGCGPCGQKLCCARFLKELDTVSINMAKNQNLSLNPSKINGVCGRLLCCLKYEDEDYKNERKNMFKIGDKIKTEYGEGKIIGLEILEGKYKVDVPEHGIVIVDKETCK